MTITIPNVLGQPTWELQDFEDAGTDFVVTTNTAVNKPEVSFSVKFNNTQPIIFRVLDEPFGVGETDAELKALFDPTVINNTGVNWTGFRIDLIDQNIGTLGDLHPHFAHFHDSTLSGWLNPNTGVFPYNQNEGYDRLFDSAHTPPPGFSSLTGASELRLSGGIFAAGTSETWSDIGIHEWGMNGDSRLGTLDIKLTPIASDDFPADPTTAATVVVGGSATTGTLEATGDHDWFRVQLTAGVRYTIDLKGDSAGSGGLLLDPRMELFDSSSQLIASNDNAGGSLNSEIAYTPTTSGTYYIDAGASFDDSVGSYWVSVSDLAHDSDFDGDGHSDILWQNASTGQPTIWEMNGTTKVGGGQAGPNPGPTWLAMGTGDFNGDGHADILWQSTTGADAGQASIWEMNGTDPIPGGRQFVGPNPGTSWHVIVAGDFNDDGHSDILWQTTNGQMSIWEMNGPNVIGGGQVTKPGPFGIPVTLRPGASWKAIAAGDFNNDGFSDVLMQNTNPFQHGELSIWKMNGKSQIGGGPVTDSHGAILNPGADWKAIGAGDFNGDGSSDVLFQNTNGDVSIWEMNGNTLIGGGRVQDHAGLVIHPGPSWKAIGAGDYNGDGFSDILLQDTSGHASIWEMSGNTQIGGGPIANSGVGWRAVGA